MTQWQPTKHRHVEPIEMLLKIVKHCPGTMTSETGELTKHHAL